MSQGPAMTDASKTPDFTRYTKDHWSCLLYIEHAVVDHGGVPDHRRMNDADRDAADRDAAEEMEADGLIVWGGTGINPVFSLTDAGWAVAGAIRRARAEKRERSEWRRLATAALIVSRIKACKTRAEIDAIAAELAAEWADHAA